MFKIIKFNLILLPLIIFLFPEYKNRADTFFNKSMYNHYDKGIVLYTDGVNNLSDNIGLQRGYTISIVRRKRTKEGGFSHMITWFYFSQSRKTSEDPYRIKNCYEIILPNAVFLFLIPTDFAIYKNSGNYFQGVGSIMPYINLGLGLARHETEDPITGLTAKMNGGMLRINGGIEYILVPPVFGLRFEIGGKYKLMHLDNSYNYKKFFNSAQRFQSFEIKFSTGLVAYVF